MTRRRIRRKQKVCEACHQEFQANRRDARFCSGRCRQRAHRAGAVTEDPLPVTIEGKAVTDEEKPKSQFAHNIAVAEAYLEWKRWEKPTL